jgi:hypothetical protein
LYKCNVFAFSAKTIRLTLSSTQTILFVIASRRKDFGRSVGCLEANLREGVHTPLCGAGQLPDISWPVIFQEEIHHLAQGDIS